MYRSHDCGALRMENVGSTVTLSGWLQVSRDFGGMTFIDMRDRYGITQIVFNMEDDVALCERARKLGREDVIRISGTCLLYTSPSPRDQRGSRMPSSA